MIFKQYIIEQPPLTAKFRLLVDDINETATFGLTTDRNKIRYNRKILGQDLAIKLETYTALSDKGTTVVLPLGRFVGIWQISKDEKNQRMWFIDHKSPVSFREVGQSIMGDYFSENLYNEFENIQAQIRELFCAELDIIELVTVNE